MDHFALPDDELSRAQEDGRLHRNFMGYTVQTSPDMLGLGMSSIDYIDGAFFQSHSKLTSYQSAITDHGYATFRGMRLSDDDLVRQYVITSLMCNFKLAYHDLSARFDVNYSEYFSDEHSELAPFIEDGFLEETEAGLEILPLGRTFVRNICMTFDAYLSGKADDSRPTFSRTI
jgi:oxygen-independent coproporphyrinogen-3 oxidase